VNKLLYILSMEREENREGHHYNLNIHSCLAEAVIEGLEHEQCRAGKYTMRIEASPIGLDGYIKEVPREVCLNYAKLKYPERFDDKMQLVEAAE